MQLPVLVWDDSGAHRASFAGSRLEIDHVRVEGGDDDAAGWWARFDIVEGWMRQGGRPYFEARGTAKLRDSGPIVALAAERRPLPEWVQRILEVRDVSASGAVELLPGEVRLRDVRALGESIELRGEFQRRDGRQPDGLFYARWRGLDVGLRLAGEERDYKLRRPLEWFESERAAWRPGG
jgi:hypothetical protein